MKKITGTFRSSSGLCDIHFYIYTPEKPKAVLMLSHGMCEYTERYEDFAEFLCRNDIAFCGNDHLGHGKSVSAPDMLGYFGSSRGYINMVRDLRRMSAVAKMKFPELPLFLMGHSMGSFLARIFLSKYSDGISGAIIMGTAGGVTGSAPLRAVLDLVSRTNGELHRSTVCTNLAFGAYNLKIDNHRTSKDWLSRDDKNVDKYCADPLCNFTFTVAGYRDMLNALLCCNSDSVIENTPTNIPILFLSGNADPVGEYGKGVKSVVEKYLAHGCRVNYRLYNGARHELLFELNRDEVKRDILDFLIDKI